MKIKFREEKFNEEGLKFVELVDRVTTQYSTRLTSRQVYYWFVSHVPGFPNTEQSYKRTTDLISRGRMAGLIDWSAIEDRGRVADLPQSFASTSEAFTRLADAYKVDRWADQPNYGELWVEKQALAGVLGPIADKLHVPFLATRGYASQSTMFESAMRLRQAGKTRDNLYVFYLGDFDPSGEDMVRDIRDRLQLFGVERLTVEKLALTWAQVQQYQPPPNPAKVTDPRAEAYISAYGHESWEVDALDPSVIETLILDAFKGIVDSKLLMAAKKKEKADKKFIRSLTGETK